MVNSELSAWVRFGAALVALGLLVGLPFIPDIRRNVAPAGPASSCISFVFGVAAGLWCRLRLQSAETARPTKKPATFPAKRAGEALLS